jgi:hypothetical protein
LTAWVELLLLLLVVKKPRASFSQLLINECDVTVIGNWVSPNSENIEGKAVPPSKIQGSQALSQALSSPTRQQEPDQSSNT